MASAAGVSCPCPMCKGKPVTSVKARGNHLKICYSAKDEVATVSNVPEESEKSQTEEEEIKVEFLSELELDHVSKFNSFFIPSFLFYCKVKDVLPNDMPGNVAMNLSYII